MTILSNVDYFKDLPFFNVSIEKPKIKRSKNIDLLPELPFYNQLNIIKADQAFGGYTKSYKVEIVDKKDSIVPLQASKSSIKDLFNDLLNETKGFKYQITVKVLLKQYKPNEEIGFTPMHFNSSTKTIINNIFKLEHAFQEVLYRIDTWINKGSGFMSLTLLYVFNIMSTLKILTDLCFIKQKIKIKNSFVKVVYSVLVVKMF